MHPKNKLGKSFAIAGSVISLITPIELISKLMIMAYFWKF